MEITKDTTKEEILKLTAPCNCEACTIGCKFGSGAFAPEEITPLANFLEVSQEELKRDYLESIEKFHTKGYRPKIKRKEGLPFGQCIFFDDFKGCMIHDVKPFECKLAMGCKPYGEELITWFNLNYFVNTDDPESIREWDLASKTKKMIKGSMIEDLVPDEKQRKKIREYADKNMGI